MKIKTYSWRKFIKDAKKLASEIKPLVEEGEISSIYGVPRGGVILAARLAYALRLPLVERKSINSATLVVDDIAGTGETLKGFAGNHIVTLFFCKESSVEPNFWAREAKYYVRFPWAPEDSLGRGSK